MKRVEEKITEWIEADQALAQLGHLRRELATLAAWRDEAIAKAKTEYAARVLPLAAQIEPLESELQRFTLAHMDDLEERSRKLTHGRLGFLLVWELKVRSLKTAVAWLVEAKKWPYLRVKHELNKETLWEAPPEVLKACGARRHGHNDFWYEVNDQRFTVED